MFSSGKNKNGCFDCDNCPRTSDDKAERYCHMFWEYNQQNDKGDTRLVRECGFRALPMFLVEVIKASNRPAAAVESMRNLTFEGLMAIGKTMQEALKTMGVPDSENAFSKPSLEEGKPDEHALAESE